MEISKDLDSTFGFSTVQNRFFFSNFSRGGRLKNVILTCVCKRQLHSMQHVVDNPISNHDRNTSVAYLTAYKTKLHCSDIYWKQSKA